MGPPLGSGGIGENSVSSKDEDCASMGPPLGSGGIKRCIDNDNILSAASMGPPLGSGGILIGKQQLQCAVIRLQWGHRLVAVESWGAVIEYLEGKGFNGATAW